MDTTGRKFAGFQSKKSRHFWRFTGPEIHPEGGEFEEVSTTDSKESYKLVNWGEIFSVSWEAIVNDQLSAFTRVPQMQGSAMRRKQNRLVYAILLNNPTMADTGALFNATAITTAGGHANLTTGSGAPSVSTLNTLTQKMMEQKGADTTNGGILNLMPTFIIACPALRGTILELLGSSSYAVSNGNSGVRNIWQGALTPIIEGELGLAAGALTPRGISPRRRRKSTPSNTPTWPATRRRDLIASKRTTASVRRSAFTNRSRRRPSIIAACRSTPERSE